MSDKPIQITGVVPTRLALDIERAIVRACESGLEPLAAIQVAAGAVGEVGRNNFGNEILSTLARVLLARANFPLSETTAQVITPQTTHKEGRA